MNLIWKALRANKKNFRKVQMKFYLKTSEIQYCPINQLWTHLFVQNACVSHVHDCFSEQVENGIVQLDYIKLIFTVETFTKCYRHLTSWRNFCYVKEN